MKSVCSSRHPLRRHQRRIGTELVEAGRAFELVVLALHRADHRLHRELPRRALGRALQAGVKDGAEFLRAKQVQCLRIGEKNAWLSITLDEGKNRQIRRLLAAFDVAVLRLVRVAIGDVQLGELGKGQWRLLTEAEAHALASAPVASTVTRA